MADANLLKKLKEKKALDGIIAYGNIRCAIKKPQFLESLEDEGGFFAILDVYALKCTYEDYFGGDDYYDKNKLYFCKGSLVTYISDVKVIGKDVRLYGKTLSGCKIKKQNTKSSYDGVVALSFKQPKEVGGRRIWTVSPNIVKTMEEKDVKGTALQDFYAFNVGRNGFSRPESTDSIVEFTGVDKYEELDLNKLEEESNIFSYSEGKKDKIDVTKIDMHLIHNTDPISKSNMAEPIRHEVEEFMERKKEFSSDLKGSLFELKDKSEEDINDIALDIIKRFVTNVAYNYSTPLISGVNIKGNLYVTELLDNIESVRISKTNSSDGSYSYKMLAKIIGDLRERVKTEPDILYGVDFPDFNNKILYATRMISILTGLGERLISNLNSCMRYQSMTSELWFFSLINAPHVLGLMGSSLRFIDCEKLYNTFYKYYADFLSDNLIKARETFTNNLRENLLFLEAIKKSERDSSSTLVSSSRFKYGYSWISDKDMAMIRSNRLPVKADRLPGLFAMYQDQNVQMSREEIQNLEKMNPFSVGKINQLTEAGILDTTENNDIMLVSSMYKEYYIYDKLYKKGQTSTNITLEEIDEIIEIFEEEKGFKLEELQKEGIALTRFQAAVLSGCAGSGKTTTSDCMSMVIRKKLSEYNIVYCTPTGKACRRLAEVVGGTVKTLHSQFGVGLDEEPILAIPYERKTSGKTCYFLDEMAMCSTDLLYNVVKNIGQEDLIYFLGDIKQLPPIGKGCPFASLMKFLPCIELGVSKRAAEGSLVNYNTTLVNFVSDNNLVELTYDDDTFVKVECNDSSIALEALKMWKNLMQGKYGSKNYEEDDIQIITGYQTELKSWSAPQVNKIIQSHLRKNDKLLFQHTEERFFYKNDRVIHINTNNYDMRRYERESGNVFTEVLTFGTVNGEMGKLIGIISSTACVINEFDSGSYKPETDSEKKILENRLEKEEDFRDDAGIKDDKLFFVLVQVYDTDLKKDVILLYRARKKNINSSEGYAFEGSDLSNLDLAYALTTHKMQGSQSPAVILLFGSKGSPMFINRNMINVMITRSEEFVGMIGDVYGEDSAISKGRRYVSETVCKDIFNLLTRN